MRAVDTNVLVRLLLGETSPEVEAASAVINSGEPVYLSNVVVCELTWVLKSRYRQSRDALAYAIRQLIESDQIVMDRDASRVGLAVLAAGGDFSDGVILHEARRVGARDLVTFDQDFAKSGAPTVTLLS